MTKASMRLQNQSPFIIVLANLAIGLVIGCQPSSHTSQSKPSETTANEGDTEQTAQREPRIAQREPRIAQPESRIAEAEQLFERGQLEEASSAVTKLLVEQAGSHDLVLLAARIQAARNESQNAIELAEPLTKKPGEVATAATKFLVELAVKLADFELAESTLNASINRQPTELLWRHYLWQIYRTQGRYLEAAKQADVLCRKGKISIEQLNSLIQRNETFPAPVAESDDAKPHVSTGMALARWHLARGDYSSAEQALKQKPNSRFSQAAFLAFKLRVMAEQQQYDEFEKQIASQEYKLYEHADYWLALGKRSVDRTEYDVACGMYLKAVELDPTSRIAYQRLSQCLAAVGQKDDAEQFRYRGIQIAQTETVGRRMEEDNKNTDAARDLAAALLEIGRPFEALSWIRLSLASFPTRLLALERERQKLEATEGIDRAPFEVAMLGLTPTQFPFQKALSQIENAVQRGARSKRSHAIGSRFSQRLDPSAVPVLIDVAKSRNADFRWRHEEIVNLDAIPLYQSVGGGIAVFDFDLDGWPDLYFAQGGGHPEQLPCSHSNELRRNLGGYFREFTAESNSQDLNYSSGLAAGDINQDGFPDLYIGALGQNRLLINNGDGTFRDATELIPQSADYFSTSLAIADLNGDHLPDLFEANYIENENAYTEPKKRADGGYELPSPALFFAQSDRLFLALKVGGFKQLNPDAKSILPGTGLGLIVTNLDDEPGNEVFVGNDLRPNHLLRWQDNQIIDYAAISGLAIGNEGLPTGCMGIATGDFDGNGKIDLHVGNYRGESDNLYLQQDNLSFLDHAGGSGLRDVSTPNVTFGCKAIDFDRNGWLDLIMTNGHIFDMRWMQEGYKMRPTLMMSTSKGYDRVEPQDESGYWNGSYLGRAMATIDYDRDLDLDILIGHLEAPTALLENQTQPSGDCVVVELVGTASERDAIGAKVRLVFEDGSISQWVTAGDGYFCTDESIVTLSFERNRSIAELLIDWPSGNQTRLASPMTNKRFLVVEGQNDAHRREWYGKAIEEQSETAGQARTTAGPQSQETPK